MTVNSRHRMGRVFLWRPAIGLGSWRTIGENGRTMRLLLLLSIGWLACGAVGHAAEQLVKQFDGHASLTTDDFQVPDGWEIRWHSDQVLSIGVIRLDNTVIAGATGRNVGSIYLPQGGTYRIRVMGRDPISWDVTVYTLDPNAPPVDDDGQITYYQPSAGPAYKPLPKAPIPMVEPTPEPAAPAPPPLPTQMTSDQCSALVTIRGDRTQGAGFFLKTGTGTVVITTLALLSNNSNLEIDTATGTKVTFTSIQGATDRDLAMISVKDFGFPGLESGDPTSVQSGDTVLTAGTNGTPYPSEPVISVGAQRIEVNRLRALTGAPVLLAKTGKVIGVVSVQPPSLSTANFNDESFADREAARAGAAAAFALRLDDVPGWETYAWDKLQNQTIFLENFHRRTRCLDSYLNGDDEDGSKLWQSDDKLKSANASFLQNAAGGDPSQRASALHQLLFELGVAADQDMDQIGQPGNFYSYEQKRANEEIAYRQALKAQIDSYGDNVSRFNSVVSRNN